jgi:2-(1,2-epoxy-1,2-dihydrophenyl)acetyl-CoA isomerase
VSTSEGTVKTEKRNNVFWIKLNRPEVLNAINDAMGIELLEALKRAERDAEVRAVVVSGSGRAFTVGEDLGSSRKPYEEGRPLALGDTLRRKYNPIVQRIRKMDKPIVAAVNGVAAGAGFGLALACDLRAAAEKATFHEAFIKVGLVPDSGTSFWLTRMVGPSKAMEISMLGEPIDARTALSLGLVNWVFPDDAFYEEVGRIAEKLAAGPTKAIGYTKRTLNRASMVDLDSALEYEAYLQELAGKSEDHIEGAKAFFEKREPKFKGR